MMDLRELLGIEVPIVQAPVGSAASPELVAAVSQAGALGMLALTWKSSKSAHAAIAKTRELTTRPFGANLVLDFPIDRVLEVCLAERVPIISTFWGDPASVHETIRDAGAVHLHTVGSVDEARHAAEVGVDVVVAQGWEAGGHVRGKTTTLALVPAVVDAVHPVPVIAAGGIGDGRGVRAVLALGAQAAMLGTRFLAATEAHTHEVYRQHLIRASAEDACYTLCFDGGWPDAPHRALRNPTLTAWERAGKRVGEGDVVAIDAHGGVHLRYEDLMPLPGMKGALEDMAMYAGQSVELIHDVRPAAEIIAQLTRTPEPSRRGSPPQPDEPTADTPPK